ncbi:hypothetical protein Tco_1103980 [Tanacetum coccineum]
MVLGTTWDDLVGAIQEIAPTTLEGVNQRVIELSSTVDEEDEIIYSQLDDARYDRALLRARVNTLESDSPFHRRTAILMEEEAVLSRAHGAQSMDAWQRPEETDSDFSELLKRPIGGEAVSRDPAIVKSLKAQMIEIQRQQGPAKDPAEPELPEEAENGHQKVKAPQNHECQGQSTNNSPPVIQLTPCRVPTTTLLGHQCPTTGPLIGRGCQCCLAGTCCNPEMGSIAYLRNWCKKDSERTVPGVHLQDFMNVNPYS